MRSPHGMFRPLLPLLFLWVALVAAAPVRAGDKTDVLVIRNGDRITCEIREMSLGMLKVKTDDMGTLAVKWDKVHRLTSTAPFLVRRHSGRVHFGPLGEAGADGRLVVVTAAGPVELPMVEVATLEAVRADLWDRLNVSLSAGFNWTKASETSQANLSGEVRYKGRVYGSGVYGTGTTTTERDGRTTRRWDVTIYGSKDVSGRLVAEVDLGAGRNDQLGLRLRNATSLSLGYRLLTSRHFELKFKGGVAGNREYPSGDEPPVNSTEGVATVSFTFFRYDSPKSDLSFRASVYPSLSVDERVRVELDTSLRHEVFSDFFAEFKYYESKDNRPPAGAAATSDRGVVFGLGWSK